MADIASESEDFDLESPRYFLVNISEAGNAQRSWSDMKTYGFVSTGGGEIYSKYLDLLEVGSKIFVYQKSAGYVGYGTVKSLRELAINYNLENGRGPLVKQKLDQPNIDHDGDDPLLAEYVVGIEWITAISSEVAVIPEDIPSSRQVVYEIFEKKEIEELKENLSRKSNETRTITAEDTTSSPVIAPLLPPDTVSIPKISDASTSRKLLWRPVKEIVISKFKAVNETEISIGDTVTILVGPNSSGKSSILQAIHWATRCASNVKRKDIKAVVLFDNLDYIPSSDPIGIFHKGRLKSNSSSPSISTKLIHEGDAVDDSVSIIDLRAARNQAGISVQVDGGEIAESYMQKTALVSAYIPGLAGVLEKESIMAAADVRRKSASGQANVVLKNILLNIKQNRYYDLETARTRNKLEDLNDILRRIYPNLEVDVNFDEQSDIYIRVKVGNRGEPLQPLESTATGILQLIHIFSYLIRFEPKIALIEEPDSHIHPDKQRDLIEALEYVSKEFGTQIIITTHSPHIVRESSPSCRINWMNKGEVRTEEKNSIRKLLGWGGLDKSVFFFVEDEKDILIKQIVKQWPDLYRHICICPCNGIENLPRNTLLKNLLGSETLDIKVVIHRDRDFMTEREAEIWMRKYSAEGVFPWVTKGSDIEAYFCSPEYLSHTYENVSHEEASSWISKALCNLNEDDIKKKFYEKRKQLRFIPFEDIERRSKAVWSKHGIGVETVLGKTLHKSLKSTISQMGLNITSINSYTVPDHYEVAEELREVIEEAVKFQF